MNKNDQMILLLLEKRNTFESKIYAYKEKLENKYKPYCTVK